MTNTETTPAYEFEVSGVKFSALTGLSIGALGLAWASGGGTLSERVTELVETILSWVADEDQPAMRKALRKVRGTESVSTLTDIVNRLVAAQSGHPTEPPDIS
jgi:hypothetical protein